MGPANCIVHSAVKSQLSLAGAAIQSPHSSEGRKEIVISGLGVSPETAPAGSWTA